MARPHRKKSLRERLIGAWTLVSNDNILPDGTTRQLFGSNPRGILILDASGRYAQISMRPDRPKFASGNRLEGTAEEYKAVVQGTIAFFGSWTVDDENETITLRLEGSQFPNQEGEVSTRPVSVSGDELKMSIPSPGSGGKTQNVHKRVKPGYPM